MKEILKIFIFWKAALFFLAFLSVYLIPVFGNQFPYTNSNLQPSNLPYWIYSFGNFDGVHYIRIASGFVSEYSQVFFPLYPYLIKVFLIAENYVLTGLVLSSLFSLFGFYFLYKLLLIDFDQKTCIKTIILLISFPTAFYFGAIYTESLFLLLTVLSLYFIRKEKFLAASFFIVLASLTRFVGALLVISLVMEIYLHLKSKKVNLKNYLYSIISILIAPLGILSYMVYLKINFSDPLYFLTAQEYINTQRTSQPFVSLPQVYFRYLKIFTKINLKSQMFGNAVLEFLLSTTFLGLLATSFKKMRKSYWIFSFGSFIIPTLTGTLSSMPRYLLMDFLLLPFLVIFLKKYFTLTVGFFALLQAILLTFFLRGYWVA